MDALCRKQFNIDVGWWWRVCAMKWAILCLVCIFIGCVVDGQTRYPHYHHRVAESKEIDSPQSRADCLSVCLSSLELVLADPNKVDSLLIRRLY